MKNKDLILVGICFLFVQLISVVLGFQWIDHNTAMWSTLPLSALKSQLFQSLFYLHIQPPLYNLFIGIGLKFGAYSEWFFRLVHMGMGLGTTLGLFYLLDKMGATRFWTWVTTFIWLLNPSFWLYQYYLFYPLPLVFFVVMNAVLFLRLAQKQSSRAATWFFLSTVGLCFLHPMYLWVYFLMVVGGTLLILPQARPQVIKGALLPGLILLVFFVKNFLLFGIFSLNSWDGMNLAKRIETPQYRQQVEGLIAQKKLTPFYLIPPFSELGAYREIVPHMPKTGIQVLDQEWTGPNPNYNHLAYIFLSQKYKKEALIYYSHYPLTIAKTCALGWYYYFLPSSENLRIFEHNISAMGPYVALWNKVILGKLDTITHTRRGFPVHVCVILIFGYVALIGQVLIQSWKARAQLTITQKVLLFAALQILYVACITCGVAEENNRFRFQTDPLLLLILGVWVSSVVIRFKNKRKVGNDHA